MRSYTQEGRQIERRRQDRRQSDRRQSGQRLRGDPGFARKLGLWWVAVMGVLALLALNLWLQSAPARSSEHLSRVALTRAYAAVVPGRTPAPQLAGLGFDPARSGVRRLSHLGILENLGVRSAADFDRLEPAAQDCLSAQARCRAYVFRLRRVHGAGQNATFDFAQTGPGAPGFEVTFLIRDGRVAHKMLRGLG